MNKLFLIALLLICLSFSVSAAQLLKGLYPCITNASRTCQANNVQLVGGTLDTPEVVFIERFINDANCPFSGFVYQRYDGTTIRVNVSGILSPCSPIDGGTDYSWDAKKIGNYVYIFYIRQVGSYPITETYLQITRIDLATSSYSVFSSTYTVLIWGAIGIVDVAAVASNSVLYHIVGGGSVFWATLYSNGTLLAGGKSTTNTLKPYAFAYSSFFNATGYTKLFGSASTGPPRMYVFNSSMNIISNDTVISDANARSVYSIGENLIVYSTNIDGNYELYYATINSSGIGTRLTTTSANEILTSVLESSSHDGTYYLVYNTTGGTYVTSVCNSSMILGYTCSQSQSATIYPDVMLTTWDESCCSGALLGSTEQCNHFCALSNEDWLHARYSVDGKVVVPAANDSSSAYSNSLVFRTGVDGWCKACCMSCATNPGCYNMTFDNPSAKTASQKDWTYNSVSWANGKVTIICGTNLSNTGIYSFQKVENTIIDIPSWSLQAGSGDVYDNVILNSELLKLKLDYRHVSYLNAPWAGYYLCSVYSTALSLSETNMLLTASVADSGSPYGRSYTWSYFYPNYISSVGEYDYTVMCRGSTTALVSRQMSRSHQKSFDVAASCSSSRTFNSQIRDFKMMSDGNETYQFYEGQNIGVRFKLVVPDVSNNNQKLASCSVSVRDENGTLTSYPTSILGGGMSGSDSYFSTQWNGVPVIDGGLAAGNYSINISCVQGSARLYDSGGVSYCINPSTYNYSFNITNTSCLGTSNSCGTSSCDVCPSIVCVCQDGSSLDVQVGCYSQVCRAIPWADCDQACGGHEIYSLGVGSYLNEYSCLSPVPVKITAQVLRAGAPTDVSSLGVICSLSFQFSNSTNNVFAAQNLPMIYDSYYKQFTWKNLLQTNYLDFDCNQEYFASVVCTSTNFTSLLIGSDSFNVTRLSTCTDGTLLGSCSSTKPKYCDSTQTLIDWAWRCGCPNGMYRNTTDETCYGTEEPEIPDIGNLGANLTLSNLLVLVLLVPIALVAYGVFMRNNNSGDLKE